MRFEVEEANEVARALAAVAAAYGALLAREESVLDEFAVANGVGGHAWIATPLDEGRLARAVRDPLKRREVLRLCLKMAIADGDYADWGLYVWGDIADGEATTWPAGHPFTGRDAYGAFAYVKLKPGASLTFDELKAHLDGKIGKHEMPVALEIRAELPKTPVVKLSKKELKEEERAKAQAKAA